tara:strand:+ start:309 stop:1070 length:762 start_codon:yes stop_codon:yes gene_type:complete
MADGNQITIEERKGEVAHVREPNDLMGALIQAAMNPDIDADKMERMLGMYERMEAKNANTAFNQAFVLAKAKLKPLIRNQFNEQTKSNYIDLMAVADAIDPILTECGFAPTFSTMESPLDGHYRVVCDLLHQEGHEKRYQADIPIDDAGLKGTKNKTGTHAFGSTMTYGRRYLKLMIFDIATKDDDGNGAGKQPIETLSVDQMEILDDLLTRSGSDRAKFFAYAKVTGMAEIHTKNFEKLKTVLEGKMKETAA